MAELNARAKNTPHMIRFRFIPSSRARAPPRTAAPRDTGFGVRRTSERVGPKLQTIAWSVGHRPAGCQGVWYGRSLVRLASSRTLTEEGQASVEDEEVQAAVDVA